MTPRDPRQTPVGFVEVPDFHVEVARRADASLTHRPVLVGGDPNKRGKVVAASSDLQERGIENGMSLGEALDRVPEAAWVPTNMARAREASGQLRAAVRREVGAIEIVGLSGFYLRAPHDSGDALALAQRIEERVAERTGLPLRIGFAPARFAAPLVAADAGRRGARLVEQADFEDYLLAMPLERLPGVGPKTAARLAELGATDVPGLRRLGIERLEVLLGNHGRSLWLLASGEDPKPLRVKQHPKTLSREESLGDRGEAAMPSATATLEGVLVRLAEALERSLRREGLQAGRIALKLTTSSPERTETRSCSLAEPTFAAVDLLREARLLLTRLEGTHRTPRRICLVLGGLEISGAEYAQLDLF